MALRQLLATLFDIRPATGGSAVMSSTSQRQRKLPPGPKGGLVLGNTFAYLRDQLGYLQAAVRDHGDLVRLRLGHLSTYIMVNPEHIDYVLRSHADNFMKDKMTRWLIPLVGEGLLTSEGDFWRRQRKLAQPAFQRQQIERYAEVMVDHTERMLDSWTEGQVRDTHDDMARLTLAIVAKTLFGAEIGDEASVVGESLRVVMNHFMSPMRWLRVLDYLPLPSSRRYWRAIRQLDEIIYGIIRRHRASGTDTGDLLSRLLSARDEQGGGGMTDRQLRDEIVTLVLAGHETTALVLFYTFYLLAQSPEADDRLTAELRRVLGDRRPTAADVPNLRFTEWVIRESMRLYPPAWGIAREALADCEIGGYSVPKGTQIFIVQWLVHHDGRWFDEPERFKPERWDNDFIKRLPPFAYFPFGGGPRICIGNHFAMMEAVLLLATIARKFRLTLEPGQTLELLPSITLRPQRALHMRLWANERVVIPSAEIGRELQSRAPAY
jgi:cytochrome P450